MRESREDLGAKSVGMAFNVWTCREWCRLSWFERSAARANTSSTPAAPFVYVAVRVLPRHYCNSCGTGMVTFSEAAHSVPLAKVTTNPAFFMASAS